MIEPLDEQCARRLFREIVSNGEVAFSHHAREEMAKDAMIVGDVLNLLRGGVVEPPEYENGSWRYRVRTDRMCVVVAIRSRTELAVVTAWRNR